MTSKEPSSPSCAGILKQIEKPVAEAGRPLAKPISNPLAISAVHHRPEDPAYGRLRVQHRRGSKEMDQRWLCMFLRHPWEGYIADKHFLTKGE
ncbi:hypothetical protein VB716_05245 [Synechococcus sp. CCY9201]|uniref:hypothetical protein n=1 Tax=unclassified Synechococcus TaxID=2626047 RepID=UPI002AD35F43|nr:MULTISPECIES: hypothetical protein [unclassified Synechococcus]MEA5473624.1 hypothetical protein [Synechococcus sp. CCY9201]